MGTKSISEGKREWLVDQLKDWQSRSLIASDQATQILDLYESEDDLAHRKHSTAMLTLMGTAALLVGLGVLLLIGYNWEKMAAAVKLAIVFSAIVVTHVTAYLLKYRYKFKGLAEVTYFLASFFFGCGIFLIAQIFHLNGHFPDAFWWWAVGIFPIALCLDTVLVHILLVAVLGYWCGIEMLEYNSLGALIFGHRTNIANGAYTLPLFALPGIVWSYRRESRAGSILYMMLILWWILLMPFAWRLEEESIFLIGTVGGLLLFIAEALQPKNLFAIPCRLFGFLLSAGALIPLSYHELQEYTSSSHRQGHYTLTIVLTILVIVVMAATLILKSRARKAQQSDEKLQNIQLKNTQIAPLAITILMIVSHIAYIAHFSPLLFAILGNVAMIVLAFWLIHIGLRDNRGRPFAGGVLYFLLWTILRYVDLFGDFGGMIGAAMMFFLCGGALFGVAFYWRNRRKIQHG